MRFRINASTKTLCYFGLMVIFSVCLLCLVGCSTDDVNDLVDIDVKVQAELQPETITVTKSAISASLIQPKMTECGTTNIQTLMNDARDQIEEEIGVSLDDLDIDSITLDYLDATYTAVWTPDTILSIDCSLEINSELYLDVTIDNSSGSNTFSLTEDQINMVNNYLNHSDLGFNYCLNCSDDPETYTINYNLLIGITIEGII